ncbi:MAG: PEP-CTERM sorting domain-containing protein [Verrucomicrobiota bacterium]|nr:PEP-CTERM sorting domain-containing protein [Verrucomicrobiota bacterium]
MSALYRHKFSVLLSWSVLLGIETLLYGIQTDIKFGINSYSSGTTVPVYFRQNFFDTPAWSSEPSYQQIFELDAEGTNKAAINPGDIIELGFFDTDNVTVTGDSTDQSASYSPNTSTDLFKGVWTPITGQTVVGYDHKYSGTETDVGPGHFWFSASFQNNGDGSVDGASSEDVVRINADSTSTGAPAILTDELDGNAAQDSGNTFNNAFDRVKALVNASSDPYIGIRFYDGSTKASGSIRYNTIMNSNWTFTDDEELYLQLPATGAADSNLEFEFDNSSYSSTPIGNNGSSNTVGSDDYVATITYYNGTSTLSLADSGKGHIILSGLHDADAATGTITGANDNTLTLNSTSGNEFAFSGSIEGAVSAGESTIVKVGAGKQTLEGNINLAGSASGWVDLLEGTLAFKPDSGKSQSIEYIKNTTGSASLELDNAGVGTGTVIELGFANASSGTFSGTVTLTETGGTSNDQVTIKVAKNAGDYSKEQVFSGQVTGSEALVKTGSGRLKLSNSANNFTNGAGTDVIVNDGTLIAAGHANSLGGSSNTIVVNKGKLELQDDITLANTSVTAAGTDKSMVGGDGTLSNITIGGDSGEFTAVSPGQGISSSLTNKTSNQQVSLGNGGSSDNAMGDLTITTLALNKGGVYDWEIEDFRTSASGGSDFDVLKFNNLTFDSDASGTFNLNIFSLASDGTAGAVTNSNGVAGLWDDGTLSQGGLGVYKGFKFLDGSGTSDSGITWGSQITINGATPNGSTSGTIDDGFFNINQDGFAYYNNFYYGDWSVYYDHTGNDFYLQFSVVPEPSTYVMVTGLLMFPGMSWYRRFRKKAKEETEE